MRIIRVLKACVCTMSLPLIVSVCTNGGSESSITKGGVNKIIEAANFNGSTLSGKAAPNELAADFTSFGGSFVAGNKLVYNNIDFGSGGYKTIMMLLSAKNNQSNKHLDIYVNAVSSENLIAVINPPSVANDERVFHVCYATIKNVSGVHNVILSFREDMEINIDWFTFSSYTGSETAGEKEGRMKWWRDARFGQFIHFGPYSLPGGVYNARSVGGSGAEWIMQLLNISKSAYANDISKPFNPIAFNAREVVSLAKQAGQKYIVITSKHHDGFSMYDTNIRTFRDYKLTGFGDYKGPDILAELARECRAQGIVFGVYYSIPDWYDVSQDSWGNTMRAGFKDEYVTRMRGQLRELIEDYDPAVLWFDMGGNRNWWTETDGRELYRYLRTLNPSIIISNRIVREGVYDVGDFGTPEQYVHGGGVEYDWETCMTMNDSWGYKSYSSNWKTAGELITNLVTSAAGGGNYLLNIGPDGLGNIPNQSKSILQAMGEWTAIYGDSIYETQGSGFTFRDGLQATVKDGKIFVFFKGAPMEIVAPAPVNEITAIRDMRSGASLSYTQTMYELTIDTSNVDTHQFYSVIEISVTGYPKARERINYATTATNVEVTNFYQNNPTYAGNKAVDGDKNSRWATNDGTMAAMLTLTFASPITVDTGCLMQHTSPTNRTRAFLVEYLDGGEWVTAYRGDDPGEELWFDFEPFTASQIRLNVTDAHHPTYWEFQLYQMNNNRE